MVIVSAASATEPEAASVRDKVPRATFTDSRLIERAASLVSALPIIAKPSAVASVIDQSRLMVNVPVPSLFRVIALPPLALM